MKLYIGKNSTEPLYLQIANQLIQSIENGEYPHGYRLPTEDRIVCLLSVSKGTVKSAYSYMEVLGYVRKIRGSGVYVDKLPTGKSSSQLILDNFFEHFDEQTDVNCTQGYMVFRDKLDEAFCSDTKLYTAIVDSSPEMLLSMSRQLSVFDEAMIISYISSELFSGKRVINPQCRLMVGPQRHYDAIVRYSAQLHIQSEQIVWCENKQTVTSICQIPQEECIGIIYLSEGFLSYVIDTLRNLLTPNKIVPLSETELSMDIDKYANYTFIIAEDSDDLYSAKTLEFIEKMRKHRNRIIPFVGRIDNGSMNNLEEKIHEISSSRRHGI